MPELGTNTTYNDTHQVNISTNRHVTLDGILQARARKLKKGPTLKPVDKHEQRPSTSTNSMTTRESRAEKTTVEQRLGYPATRV